MPHFTEDSLQRIIINPFYAITVAPHLTVEHEPRLDEAEWVRANASLMGEMGAERWLRQLLDVLEGKTGAPGGGRSIPLRPSTSTRCSPQSIPRSSGGRCGSRSTSCKYATWGRRAGSGSCWMCSTATS